ncbi:16S rRNA (guanine(966)-N(2))-methyltransferase RsmD [Endozoicomonas sp. SCSIO W0465]|uniref:16S rRNA (guanine(966)-N(2))-methyltransferase RsmD n=1 Tax=Endozoicomonas sp. SCSIO W0465 TaxID=2918516 RepID=UPI0020761B24|nr:16S rRNA (guanine(966)-N(2))-methyltransferase RsmD [Endozoicomonas sp. SCSIO W0465]USE37265.1 16S rRNA (guanine(966)-N(2))-methyltransferase RsmD [Endozoicomonas sp. SCSIO W0465]
MPGKARHSKPHPHNGSTPTPGGQLRIIAGEWRSRKLPVANVPGLRPTSDRIRETVFNWLTVFTPGARVLDVFSGTGALSIEALSRGASSATLLEKSPVAASTLKNNLALLNAEGAKVVETDSLSWLNQPAETGFDLIFLDPPFRMNLLEPACHLLESNGYLNEHSRIYIEVEKELNPLPIPKNWQLEKSKTAGQVSFSLWSRIKKQK